MNSSTKNIPIKDLYKFPCTLFMLNTEIWRSSSLLRLFFFQCSISIYNFFDIPRLFSLATSTPVSTSFTSSTYSSSSLFTFLDLPTT
ncbi:hypothetical protein BpHYR1_017996 [Brachionus plicatilis]|uniref:Uncharacterized protein n=1 Tax=Brachionus plicatilis TaxID=10195 RepID=A0A3M7Q6E7_BRAPC|nr:hypothetical protein BpHYR1_017996 [Brachionus plicatilis]